MRQTLAAIAAVLVVVAVTWFLFNLAMFNFHAATTTIGSWIMGLSIGAAAALASWQITRICAVPGMWSSPHLVAVAVSAALLTVWTYLVFMALGGGGDFRWEGLGGMVGPILAYLATSYELRRRYLPK